jgi:hypothetical protein
VEAESEVGVSTPDDRERRVDVGLLQADEDAADSQADDGRVDDPIAADHRVPGQRDER